MKPRFAAAGLAAAMVASASPTFADTPSSDVALAAELFQRAKRMMAEGDYAPACPLLEQSQKLDPGTGTLLNLAVCHEQVGKFATAWAEYQHVTVLAAAASPPRLDRLELAKAHAAALAPRVSHIALRVDHPKELEFARISLDGVSLETVLWNTDLPADPGVHEVRAEATGKVSFKALVDVKGEGDRAMISVPRLQSLPRRDVSADVSRPASTTGLRVAGLSLLGVGAVASSLAAGFGVAAMSLDRASDRLCQSDPCASEEGVRKSEEADRWGTAANISGAVGVATLVVGTYLTWRSTRTRSQSVSGSIFEIVPTSTGRTGALVLRGRF